MQNRDVPSAAAATYVVMEMDRRAKVLSDPTIPLPFGTHVSISNSMGLAHSSIAIGIAPDGRQNTPNPTDHMQVFNFGSNLGIAPLAAGLEYFGQTVRLPQPLLRERVLAHIANFSA